MAEYLLKLGHGIGMMLEAVVLKLTLTMELHGVVRDDTNNYKDLLETIRKD